MVNIFVKFFLKKSTECVTFQPLFPPGSLHNSPYISLMTNIQSSIPYGLDFMFHNVCALLLHDCLTY